MFYFIIALLCTFVYISRNLDKARTSCKAIRTHSLILYAPHTTESWFPIQHTLAGRDNGPRPILALRAWMLQQDHRTVRLSLPDACRFWPLLLASETYFALLFLLVQVMADVSRLLGSFVSRKEIPQGWCPSLGYFLRCKTLDPY